MIHLILFARLLFVEQCNLKKMCDPFNVIFHYYLYNFFLQTPWKDYENVKALMEILLYVIDNKLLEVYCQVIISI
jgi:hypothetical protein